MISYGLNETTPEDLDAAGIDPLVNAGFCDGIGSGPNPDGDVDFDDVYGDVEDRIDGSARAGTARERPWPSGNTRCGTQLSPRSPR